MRFALPLLALATTAAAQNATSSAEFATGLLAALTAGGYNTLVQIVTGVGATPEGVKLLADLQSGQATLLAPSDGALAGVPASITGNATLLSKVLSYHVLSGNFTVDSVPNSPAHSIARTTLTGPEFANLPGDVGQALVLYQTNGTGIQIDAPFTKWEERPFNISTHGVTQYQNLTIVGIDEVINLPPTLSAFATQNASSIAGVLTTAGLVGPLEALKGVTVFLPVNEAVAALGQEAIAGLNESALTTILQNHVVNGTVAYSTSLKDAGEVFSLAGEKFTFNLNGANGSATVQSGNVTAKILRTDIIITNGVVHLIDAILVNTASNPQAVESIISVAATASKTSDIGVGPTQGGGAGASAKASGSAAAGAAGAGFKTLAGGAGAWKGVVAAGVMGVVAMALI